MKDTCTFSQAEAVAVTDPVRDLMVMTVPGLEQDGQASLVEPDEYMEDDGEAASFVKAFVYDDIETMQVADEVYDLMLLAVPSIGAFEDCPFADATYVEMPDDGMEATWDDALFDTEEAVPVLAIAAPAQAVLLSGPVAIPALGASEVPLICAPEVEACSETVTETIKESATAEPVAEEERPLVTFSFGPQRVGGDGWTVCFSF